MSICQSTTCVLSTGLLYFITLACGCNSESVSDIQNVRDIETTRDAMLPDELHLSLSPDRISEFQCAERVRTGTYLNIQVEDSQNGHQWNKVISANRYHYPYTKLLPLERLRDLKITDPELIEKLQLSITVDELDAARSYLAETSDADLISLPGNASRPISDRKRHSKAEFRALRHAIFERGLYPYYDYGQRQLLALDSVCNNEATLFRRTQLIDALGQHY